VNVECSDAAGLANAQTLTPQATDNCSNVTYVKTTGTFVAGTCPSSGSYTNTWRAIDACGNASVLFTQVITVQDTTAPVMTSILTNPSVTCDNIPTAPTPTFSDNCTAESNLIITATETQSATVNSQYTIVRTWTAEDACGNLSQTYTQTVTVTITTQTVDSISVARVCNNGTIETTLDLNSVVLPAGTPTNGTWINESNVGSFSGTVFDANGVADGTYIFSYNYNQTTCPQKINVLVPVQLCVVEGCDNIIVHNAFTPNGDGDNENFQIDYINQQCHLPNTVEIYNRWGVLVYDAKNYDNESVVFTGLSNGRATVSKSDELPAGTYFYILQYTDGTTGKVVTESKYLYLTR
jgi:gliding motility-associated-like protein